MFRFEQDDGLFVNNDHLNLDNQKESGMNDHGLIKSSFVHRPTVTSK